MLLAALFLTLGTAWAQTAATYADGLYKVYWQSDNRGYLTYHEGDYPNEPQLSGVTLSGCESKHYASDAEGIKVAWYLYTSTFTKKSYLFEATTGKFIAINPGVGAGAGKACALTEEVTANAQMSLFATTDDKAGSYMLRYKIGNTNYHFCSGCGSNKDQHPVRFSTDGQSDGGTRFVFEDAEGLTISDEIKNAAIAKIKAYEVDRLLTGENETPKYFAIKNVGCSRFAIYDGDATNMLLRPYFGAAGRFYFTGALNAEGTALVVKIHNEATNKLCASVGSWTESGIDWYIQMSGSTSNPGFAISSNMDLTHNDYSWNDYQGSHTSISTWKGNDGGSTWEFISAEEADLRTLPEMSTTASPKLYFIRNARHNGKYANCAKVGTQFAEIASPGLGSYWYFVEDTEAAAVDGWVACKIYNAISTNGVSDPLAGSFENATYYIKKHDNGTSAGFAITKDPTDATNGAWNDAGGNGNAISNYKYDDIGSVWWIEKANKTADNLKSEAATAKTNALNTIGVYELADYYTYSDEAIASAKATIEAINTNDLASAVSGHMGIEPTLATLRSTTKGTEGPQVGDYIRFKNRAYPVYLATTDNADNVIRKSDNANDLKTIWLIEEGSNGSVLLKNVGTEKYVGNIAQSADVKQVEKNDAAQLTFSNLANDVYGRFQKTGGDDYSFANMNEWDGSYQLKGWSANEGNNGSHWLMTQAYPLTVVYNFKGDDLAEQGISTFVDAGATYTIPNPYANKYVNVTCAVNGNRVEPVDGQWTVNVTEPTSVIVTITEDLPFKTSTSFATANWQYLQINSGGWEYVRNYVANGEENTYANTTNSAELDEGALWAFVGDALGGFKILNKKAGEGFTLSYDGEMANGTAAYMKQEEKTWTIEKGNGGFIIRQGANQCLNDFGDRLKVWAADGSPTGTGSAFRTISGGVKDLSDLYNSKIYVLQAERSQLMYDANASNPSKLSSGMVNNIAANGSDANQQFMIIKPEENFGGKYYLYNVGAAKFVDANLNFTDYPEPVLSFDANEGNSVFPWFVKIGGKYVVPGADGTAGNKIYHTETPAADAGKWYRIEEVDEDMSLAVSVAQTIQAAEGLVKNASQLSNDKVYAVYTYDRGAWYHNGDDALWSTGKTAKSEETAENADHFAFLTVNGKIYLYSVGAGKFIVKSETAGSTAHTNMYYATYSDIPTQTVELSPATNGGWFPVVVKLNVEGPNQLSVSNAFSYPVIMYDDLADTGNQVRIEEVGTLDLSDVVAVIGQYQMDEEAKGGLQALMTEATTKNTYLENASLTAAITAAQAALNKVGATYDELMTAKENLAAALNSALYVTEIDGFSNDYVYTFVSKRGWMGADNTDGVISGTGADDNANYQWAVYKSREHYYLYNIGKTQFMGVETRNNTQMPFSATPQTTGLTFKKSAWADYPIMFSMDNQNVVNNDNAGKMICWTGGWSKLDDEGSNHKVTIVGKIESSTLTTIAAAVELYETQGVAVQALDAAIAAAQAKVDGIGAGLGYYSTTEADAAATLAAIVGFKNAITGETTVAAIEAQTAAANALVATFSVNLPEVGKFYRFSYDYGTAGVKYVQAVASGVSKKANAMLMTEEQGAASIFYYDGGADTESVEDDRLLSYSAGQYVNETGNTRGLQTVGNTGGKAKFEAGSKAGKLYIFAGDSFHANKSGEICFIDHCGAGHPDKGAGDEHNFTVEEVTTLPVNVTSVGYATLYAPVALEIPDGVTAYVGVKEDNYLALTDIKEVTDGDVIPANTGVILESQFDEGVEKTAKTFNFDIATENIPSALEASKNLLTGKYPKSEKDAAKKVYTLQNGDNGVGFYLFKGTDGTSTTYINGFRAWVEFDAAQPAQALAFRFRGKEQGTTEIEMPMSNGQQPAAIYDLTGRRITEIVEKGIYIVNGKKVVIK